MRLTPGTPAPAFEMPAFGRGTVSLADYAGQKVWLAFFRYASCPLCNLRVRDIMERYDALRAAGVEVLAVFQSPEHKIAKYVGKHDSPFPIVMDPDEQLYATYGVELSTTGFLNPVNLGLLARAMAKGNSVGTPDGSMTRIPADFLIDADGTITDAYYGKVIADHIPFERVDAFVAA